jgi:hypothetical protein
MCEVSDEQNSYAFFEAKQRAVSLLTIWDRDCVAWSREEIVDCGRFLLGTASTASAEEYVLSSRTNMAPSASPSASGQSRRREKLHA